MAVQPFQLCFPEVLVRNAWRQITQSVMSREGSARTPLQVPPNAALLFPAGRGFKGRLDGLAVA